MQIGIQMIFSLWNLILYLGSAWIHGILKREC
jgi:hypothetical protein